MKEVAVSELQTGDVLAAPVFRKDGGLLVDAGVEITRTLLRALQTARIAKVSVIEAKEELEDESSPKQFVARQTQLRQAADSELERRLMESQIEDLKDRLSELYAPHHENPSMMALHDATLEYLTRRILSKELKRS